MKFETGSYFEKHNSNTGFIEDLVYKKDPAVTNRKPKNYYLTVHQSNNDIQLHDGQCKYTI